MHESCSASVFLGKVDNTCWSAMITYFHRATQEGARRSPGLGGGESSPGRLRCGSSAHDPLGSAFEFRTLFLQPGPQSRRPCPPPLPPIHLSVCPSICPSIHPPSQLLPCPPPFFFITQPMSLSILPFSCPQLYKTDSYLYGKHPNRSPSFGKHFRPPQPPAS